MVSGDAPVDWVEDGRRLLGLEDGLEGASSSSVVDITVGFGLFFLLGVEGAAPSAALDSV